MTQGRISVFNQDVIPHILRTKLIPELEEAETAIHKSAKEIEQIKAFDVNSNFCLFFALLVLTSLIFCCCNFGYRKT